MRAGAGLARAGSGLGADGAEALTTVGAGAGDMAETAERGDLAERAETAEKADTAVCAD